MARVLRRAGDRYYQPAFARGPVKWGAVPPEERDVLPRTNRYRRINFHAARQRRERGDVERLVRPYREAVIAFSPHSPPGNGVVDGLAVHMEPRTDLA